MRLEQHVLSAIDDYERGNMDAALMHACFAIDATAKKLFNKQRSSAKDYKECIRSYYWLVERFIGDGFNLEETRWIHISLNYGSGKQITSPDIADIIYHVFRCCHAHAEEVPIEYQLIRSTMHGYSEWVIDTSNKRLHMPDKIIWALLAIAVFCNANSDCHSEGDYTLSWGSEMLMGVTHFRIRDYWGKEEEIRTFLSQFEPIRIKMQL